MPGSVKRGELLGPSWGCLAGEEVLGIWPSRCRKTNGGALITAQHMVHVPDGAGAAGATIVRLKDVQRYSFSQRKKGDERACVQLVTEAGPRVVELTSTSDRWAHMSELQAFIRARENEQVQVQEEQVREAELVEPQMRVVMDCPELREQYSYLVGQSQALTQQEFLKSHAQDIAMRAPLQSPPSNEFTMLRPGSTDTQAPNVIPEEEARAIFRELPPLELLYNAEVPSTIGPAQFWARCLRSRYYLEATGREVPPGYKVDPLFDRLERVPEKTSLPTPAIIAVTSDINADLTGEAPRDMDKPVKKRKAWLMDKLNEHSAGSLKARKEASAGADLPCEAARGEATPTELAGAVERRREALRRSVETLREDMDASCHAPTSKIVRLRLDKDRLCSVVRGTAEVTTAHAGTVNGLAAHSNCAVVRALRAWAAGTTLGRSSGTSELFERAARWVMREATQEIINADLIRGAPQRVLQEPPRDVTDVITRAKSLLQHFWASRQRETDKRERLVRELNVVMKTLQDWQGGTQGRRMNTADALARHAARSFIPPVRRALDIHNELCHRG